MSSDPSLPPEVPLRPLAPAVLAGVGLLALLGGLAWWLSRSEAPAPRAEAETPAVAPAPASVADPPPPPPPEEEKPSKRSEPGPPPLGLGATIPERAPPAAPVPRDPNCGDPCTGRETSELLSALGATAARARGCYERALSNDPGLAGKLEIGVRVSRAGTACSASVAKDDLGDVAVTGCVLSRFRSGKYPLPTGGCVDVSVPMNFMPAGSR
jgi:hypothetical protein